MSLNISTPYGIFSRINNINNLSVNSLQATNADVGTITSNNIITSIGSITEVIQQTQTIIQNNSTSNQAEVSS